MAQENKKLETRHANYMAWHEIKLTVGYYPLQFNAS